MLKHEIILMQQKIRNLHLKSPEIDPPVIQNNTFDTNRVLEELWDFPL